MKIVNAHDVLPNCDRRKVAKAYETAFDVTGQLRLNPKLGQPGSVELRQYIYGNCPNRKIARRAWGHDIQPETSGQWVAGCDQGIERQGDFPRVSRYSCRFQRHEIAVDRPDAQVRAPICH
jgi:hypothetical protein